MEELFFDLITRYEERLRCISHELAEYQTHLSSRSAISCETAAPCS
jgi:hypothetical protein